MNKIAICDIDGTIANHGEVPEVVMQGVRNLHKKGFYTTVCTGRGYGSVVRTLGDNFNELVSDGALLSLEHGSKVTTKSGEILFADYFQKVELEHMIDFIFENIDMVKFLWFVCPDPKDNYQIWMKEEKNLPKMLSERGAYADVFQCSKEDLREKLLRTEITSLRCQLEDHIKVENLKIRFAHIEVAVIYQDGGMEFVRHISNKARSIEFVERHLNIPPENMLLAGNAINDVEMLNVNAGHRVLVGDVTDANVIISHLNNKHDVKRVESPEKLGEFLQQIC